LKLFPQARVQSLAAEICLAPAFEPRGLSSSWTPLRWCARGVEENLSAGLLSLPARDWTELFPPAFEDFLSLAKKLCR